MENKLDIKPAVVIEAEVKKQVEYKKIGYLKKVPGLTVFTYNISTGGVEKLKVEKKVSIGLDKKVKRETRASHDPNVVYIQALNLKNAKRKAEKLLKTTKERDECNSSK